MKIFAVLIFGIFLLCGSNSYSVDCPAKDASDLKSACGRLSESDKVACAACTSSDNPNQSACNDAYEAYRKDIGDEKKTDISDLQAKLTKDQADLQNIKPELETAINKIDQEISDLKNRVTDEEAAVMNQITEANAAIETALNNIKDAQANYKTAMNTCQEKARSDALNLLKQLQLYAHMQNNGGGPGSTVANAFAGQSDLAIIKGDVMSAGWDDLVSSGNGQKTHHDSYADCTKAAHDAETSAIRKFNTDRTNFMAKVNTLTAQLNADGTHESEQLATLLKNEQIAQEKAMVRQQQLSAEIAQLQQQIAQKQFQGTASTTRDYAYVCGSCFIDSYDPSGKTCSTLREKKDDKCSPSWRTSNYAIKQLCGGSSAGKPGGAAAQ